MRVVKEFIEFLKEYKVIAFIIGVAATSLVNSLVKDVIMPILTPFIPGGLGKLLLFSWVQ